MTLETTFSNNNGNVKQSFGNQIYVLMDGNFQRVAKKLIDIFKPLIRIF